MMQRVSLAKLVWDERCGLHCSADTPFTGVAFSLYRDGALKTETEYQGGVRSGLHRKWSPEGVVVEEGNFREDVIHGTYRKWHQNSRLAAEQACEYGITLSEKRWDEQGMLLREYLLTESDPDWELLQRCRQLYGNEEESSGEGREKNHP